MSEPDDRVRRTLSNLGWWAISGEAVMAMLQRVEAGEDPALVYAEEYANADHPEPGDGSHAADAPLRSIGVDVYEDATWVDVDRMAPQCVCPWSDDGARRLATFPACEVHGARPAS